MSKKDLPPTIADKEYSRQLRAWYSTPANGHTTQVVTSQSAVAYETTIPAKLSAAPTESELPPVNGNGHTNGAALPVPQMGETKNGFTMEEAAALSRALESALDADCIVVEPAFVSRVNGVPADFTS